MSITLGFSAVPAVFLMMQGVTGPQIKTEPPPPPQSAMPLPAPEIYDPQWGPFIVHLNGKGEIQEDQYGVIANAVNVWSGPNLQSFEICLHSPHNPDGGGMAFNALNSVARELKTQGAKIVVMPSGGFCIPYPDLPHRSRSYVLIMGVVQV